MKPNYGYEPEGWAPLAPGDVRHRGQFQHGPADPHIYSWSPMTPLGYTADLKPVWPNRGPMHVALCMRPAGQQFLGGDCPASVIRGCVCVACLVVLDRIILEPAGLRVHDDPPAKKEPAPVIRLEPVRELLEADE